MNLFIFSEGCCSGVTYLHWFFFLYKKFKKEKEKKDLSTYQRIFFFEKRLYFLMFK